MSTGTVDVVGTARDRVDGRLKVMGAATYPIDVNLPGLAHAALVQSTITSGRIRDIAVDAAERAPGVVAVITHLNTPPLAQGPPTEIGPQPSLPFQSDAVLHYGQHVAMVVAETREQANAAAALIEVTYERNTPVLSFEDERATEVTHPWTPDYDRGDVSSALAAAEVRINQIYTTAENTNNPIGLFATVAVWDGDALTVHDTTQNPHGARDALAAAFGVDPAGVRILVPFVGGAFGAGLRVWPHVPLAALAARITKRPVKVVLTRAQMFTTVGHRPNTIQQLSVGASRDGLLAAIDHGSRSSIGMEGELINLVTNGSITAYACPNVSTRARQIRQSIPIPGWMRAPGEAEGSFALESAIDELSYALNIDPIELRIKNHAHVHPDNGLPWSSNALLDCYREGAERFGWSARNPEPRSMRNGGQLVGYGVGRGALGAYQPPCKAIATIRRDGTAFVRSGGTDMGPGTYTVMTMLAADCLGVPIERVRFGLGDSAMPKAPQEGGSGFTGALGNAVHATCVSVVRAFVNLVSDDAMSPLKGCRLEGITVRNGGIQITDDPARFETYAHILTRHGLDEMTIEGESAPPGETSSATMIVQEGRFIPYTAPSTGALAHAGAYAAHFVEVHVDPDLGSVRVARVVSAIDGGRILNPKTARSQIIGGIAMGIGMALLEETVSDRTGRLVTMSLAEYVVAVNADVRDVDVLFVGQPDAMTPLGTKGIGELAITGMAAAIANAVYHATGTRVRSLPISIEKVLGHESSSSPLDAIAGRAGRVERYAMRKLFHRMLGGAALLAASVTGGTWIYTQHPKFGKLPDGARLDTIKRSPNYSGDGFQNLIPTPVLVDDRSFVSVGIRYLFAKKDRPVPTLPIPSVKTDLQSLDRNRDVVAWLGHSSYFIQLGGKRILIDPVFSASAGPVPYLNKAFDGTNPYTAEDVPEIDYLLITHDHWDHLDYSTVTALRAKTKTVVCGLGVGAHLERWGYDKAKIHEADWYSVLESGDGFAIHVLPARHYSGRLLTRNKALWAGYALTTASRRIFVSGDSGYGPHFAEIGHRFGGFDLVALDTGQYDEQWPHIHMTPEEAARAAQDLQAGALLPGHVGKFSLARHSWDAPFRRITAASEGRSYRLLTPIIGSPMVLDDRQQRFSRWWEDLAQSPADRTLAASSAKGRHGVVRVDKPMEGTLKLTESERIE